MKTFDEMLRQRLSEPVKDKSGHVLISQDGDGPMTAQEAMVMSVVNNAMKGDLAAISLIRNLTQSWTQEEDRQAHERSASRMESCIQDLIRQLKAESLYDGQDKEISMLAATGVMIEYLTDQMSGAGFQPVITIYGKSGVTTVPHPLIKMRDEQQDRFRQQLDKIRMDALKRVQMKKFNR